MQVHADAQPGFVDLEESTQPRAEEAHHLRVAVGEVDLSIGLAALTGVERDSRREKRLLVELTETASTLSIQVFHLEQFRSRSGWRRRCRPRRRREGVNGTSRTQSDTDDFETPRVSAMSARVRFWARRARARSCSLVFPR